MGIVQILMKCLSIQDAFGMGDLACPINTNPLAILTKHCKTDMKKQWQGCKKIKKTLVKMLF
jgi:hypothetical protein